MTPDGHPATPAGLHPETAVICAGRPGHAVGGPLNVPVVLASNFQAGTMAAPGTGEGSRAYSRTDATPTWEALEAAVGQVEGGHAVAFSSGMAAVAAVLDLVPAGRRIVAPDGLLFRGRRASGRRPAARTLGRRPRGPDRHRERPGRRRRRGPALAGDPLQPAARQWPTFPPCAPPAATPGPSSASTTPSPRRCCNSPWHSARTWSCTAPPNSSAATPTCCPASPSPASRPSPSRLRHRRGLSGATPGALEAFLALRGLRTLALRLDRGQANAAELARRLDEHPAVSRVRYPGLPGDPGHRTAAAQMTGFGAVLAFEVADAPTADRLCDAVHVIVHATSLGGVESTIERRSKLPGQEHVPPGLLRLSVGCEHIDDLWNDLNTALGQATDRATRHRTTGRKQAGCQVPVLPATTRLPPGPEAPCI